MLDDMNHRFEVKYEKVSIDFGQRLKDLPTYHRWRNTGWKVTWLYKRVEGGSQYIETLLKRSARHES